MTEVRAVILRGPLDVSVECVPAPTIVDDRDVLLRVLAAGICGSDLHDYTGRKPFRVSRRLGHEYVGVVVAIGVAVRSIAVGDTVIGGFRSSCGVCRECLSGNHHLCSSGEPLGRLGAQSEMLRVPLADGTLLKVKAPRSTTDLAALVALCDVVPTGHHAINSIAESGLTRSLAVVGDGAVGLSTIAASQRMGVQRIVCVGHVPERMELALRLGASERLHSDQARSLGEGFDCVVDAVGSTDSISLSLKLARPGGAVRLVGAPAKGATVAAGDVFQKALSLSSGETPVRRHLTSLTSSWERGEIEPDLMVTRSLPLAKAAEGYNQMARRKTLKVMLTV